MCHIKLWDTHDYVLVSNEVGVRISMLSDPLFPKPLTYNIIVHVHIILTGFQLDGYMETKIIIMYVKCGELVDAHWVLNKML